MCKMGAPVRMKIWRWRWRFGGDSQKMGDIFGGISGGMFGGSVLFCPVQRLFSGSFGGVGCR